MFIEILFKMLLFKGGVLIYAEHCIFMVGNKLNVFMEHDFNIFDDFWHTNI